MQWHPSEEDPGVLRIGRTLMVVPGLDPQCVARTRRGTRCKNGTFSSRGPVYVQERGILLWSTRGLLPVWEEPDPTEARLWDEQRCAVHDTPEATDHTAPEWYHFDPDRDTHLVEPIPSLPRMPSPPREWEPVSWELAQLWEIGRRQRRGTPQGLLAQPRWDLEPAPTSPSLTACAALEQILATHHDLPSLQWTVTTSGRLHGVLPARDGEDLDDRRAAFTCWAERLDLHHHGEIRRKGYLVLHARNGDTATVPIALAADLDDGIA